MSDTAAANPDRLRRVTLGVLATYSVAVLLVATLAILGLDVLAAIQSHIRGESLWAKAQTEAVSTLREYAATGEQEAWDRYLDALEVPLGDRRAREEMARDDPDPEIVRQGFVEGGLHPDEVGGMMRLHRWFGGWEPMRRARDVWARGDSLIADLHREAGRIRLVYATRPLEMMDLYEALERVDDLNRRLREAELEFAEVMSEAGRRARRTILWAVGGLAALLLFGGLALSWVLYRVILGRETELRRAESRYRRIFESSQDAIYVSDVDGTIRAMNPAGVELLGYRPDEVDGLRAQDLYADPDERRRFQREIEEEGQVDGFQVQLRTRDGRVLDCEISSTARVEHGEVVGYQGIIRDVTERKKFEQELERQALHDALTGLPNRVLLWDRLEQAVVRCARGSGPLAVLFVDLDRFKAVNDSLSHAAGDQVLVRISNRLRASVRNPDTVARMGGDEFVILLEELEDPGEVERVAERIERALEPPCPVAGEEVHLDASIGSAVLEPEEAREFSRAEAADELVRRADSAMYEAKGERGTTFHRFVHDRSQMRRPRIQRENELRKAIEEEDFVLHYQSIVSLPEGRIVAVEPLVRWAHPERGLLPPDDFLALAEDTGMILELGAWVLEAACRQAAEWNRTVRADDPVLVHPNLSAIQFEDPDLEERLGEILDVSGLAPEHLELEVTEHSVMQAPTRTRALADMGVGVCIDDFGTGYSSLSYVRELAANALKIDMSFVHGIGEMDADEAIIRTILTMGRSLGLRVVAEGVETEEQRRWLQEEQCPWAQGFLFGRPEPAEAFAARLGKTMPLTREAS